MENTTLNFEGSKLEIVLEAQTPLIHFQYDEEGATLRGSELKPKLDKFLCRKMEKEEKDVIPMDYKVRIKCGQEWKKVEIGTISKKYSLYYGNTRQKTNALGVWSNFKLTIICFDKKLQKYIAGNIVEFFYVTNFGAMQNKGFGSFIPKDEVHNEYEIAGWLNDEHGTNKCWYCSYNGNGNREERSKKQFEWIKYFYSIMKSGWNHKGYERSFLFQYMHKLDDVVGKSDDIIKNIDNEKAWMKQQEIAPIYSSNEENKTKHDLQANNSKYVRAFMGLAGIQSWKCGDKEKTEIKISDPSGTFERIPSPVFFKIVGNIIYFVITSIPDRLYNYKFEFKGLDGKSLNLNTPSRADFEGDKFDTEKFMEQYVKYFNGNKIKVKSLNSLKEENFKKGIKEVK